MLQRGQQPSASSTAAAEDEFRIDVEDLFADNILSGQRTSKLLHKASAAGIRGINRRLRRTIGVQFQKTQETSQTKQNKTETTCSQTVSP